MTSAFSWQNSISLCSSSSGGMVQLWPAGGLGALSVHTWDLLKEVRAQEKGAVTPQETALDLLVSVQESPAEA